MGEQINVDRQKYADDMSGIPKNASFFLSNEIVSVSNEKYNLFASMYAFNGIFRHIIVICISVYYHNLYSINHSLYNSMNYNICFFFLYTKRAINNNFSARQSVAFFNVITFFFFYSPV